jgi:hypothetical protein
MNSLFFPAVPILVLLAAAAVLFSMWSYRRTVPAARGGYRLTLVLLRAAALTLTGFVLLRPVLEFSMKRQNKPRAVVLVDDSRSMSLADGGRTRADRAREILKSKEILSWMNSFDASLYRFSDRFRDIPGSSPDSLTFQGPATDMAAAFGMLAAKAEAERPSAVILLSDGVNTLGRDPVRAAENLGVPVHTICAGSIRVKPDVMITRVTAPPVATAESDVPVEVSVRGEGFGGKPATVSLSTEGESPVEKKIELPPDGLETTVRLLFKPATFGNRTVCLSVTRFPNELTWDNNTRVRVIRVLRRKMNVLLLAGGPGPDLAFIKRIVEADPDVRLVTRTLKSASAFYEGPFPGGSDLRDVDAFILLNVPGRLLPEAAWQALLDVLLNARKPFFGLTDASLDLRRLRSMDARFPAVAVPDPVERLVVTALTAEGEAHPALRVRENPAENRKAWESLPPVYSSWARVAAKQGCAVLVEGLDEGNAAKSGQASVPLIVCDRRESGKSIVVFADGIFRWDLASWGLGGNNDALKAFLGNSLRWLAAEDDGKPVRFVDPNPAVQAGEETVFSVQATDEMIRPLSGADVSVSFLDPPNEQPVPLDESGEGLYRGAFRPGEPGMHRAVAEARVRGRVIGRDTTSFRVLPYAAELLVTRANPDLLRSISNATGGKVIPPDSLSLLSRMANVRVETVKIPKRFELFNWPWLLIPAGIFLVLEWILRRRAGMA